MNIKFSYYYGKEADQYSFFKIPKILYTDSIFKTLSSDAKVLYAILLDRMSLSMKNGWLDEENKVFIIFTIVTSIIKPFTAITMYEECFISQIRFIVIFLSKASSSNMKGDRFLIEV